MSCSSSNSFVERNRNTILVSSVALALAGVAAAATLVYRRRRRHHRNNHEDDDDDDDLAGRREKTSKPLGEMDLPGLYRSSPLWQEFEKAVERIRTLSGLRNGDKLLLYGLYKQATVGNAPHFFRPTSWNVVVEKAKWDAWNKMKDLTPEQAAGHYIIAAAELERELLKGDADHDRDSSSDEMLGAPRVSRPAAVDHGGREEDEDENDSLESALLTAASKNDIVQLRSLLPSVNVNHADASGQTALHLAADKGSLECVQLLVQYGANVNAADADGISVLQSAVEAGWVEIVQYLLAQGADPDQEDTDGESAKSCAMTDGTVVMKELFMTATPPTSL